MVVGSSPVPVRKENVSFITCDHVIINLTTLIFYDMIETQKMVTIKNLFFKNFRRKSQKFAEISRFFGKK